MPFARGMSQRVRRATRKALMEIGRRAVAHIRDKIGVWVEYVGSETIRSDPGEPPRRELSRLWKSIKYRVEPGATSVENLIIYVHKDRVEIAWYLEEGTVKMEARPFWRISEKEIRSSIRSLFRQLMSEFLKESDPIADFPATDSALPEDKL